MRTITTRQDIEDLSRARAVPTPLTEHIIVFFRQLEDELADDEEDTFDLDQYGPIVLLEAHDTLSCLSVAGLNGDDFFRAIEFVEPLNLDDVQAYRLVAMLDNDCEFAK